jgi:cation transporter-like permease
MSAETQREAAGRAEGREGGERDILLAAAGEGDMAARSEEELELELGGDEHPEARSEKKPLLAVRSEGRAAGGASGSVGGSDDGGGGGGGGGGSGPAGGAHADDAALRPSKAKESHILIRGADQEAVVEEFVERFDMLLRQLPASIAGTEQAVLLREKLVERYNLALGDATSSFRRADLDPTITVPRIAVEVWGRSAWLVVLLILQSFSSFILESYAELISTHVVVTFFLTMLVGAGGNAGNQSAVMIIRGLALGIVREENKYQILLKQFLIGILISLVLVVFGYLRVVFFGTDMKSALAISLALFLIVVVAVALGAVLPLVLNGLGIDAAHAGPAIQVLMDIIGISITCLVCATVFGMSSSQPIEQPAMLPRPHIDGTLPTPAPLRGIAEFEGDKNFHVYTIGAKNLSSLLVDRIRRMGN